MGDGGGFAHAMEHPLANTTGPKRIRSEMRMLRTAVRNGWDIPERAAKALPAFCLSIMETSDDDRARIAAAKVLLDAQKANIDNELALDKIERLDEGSATDNQSVTVRFVNRLNEADD